MTPWQTSWQYPPLDLKLIQRDVHVWHVNLNEPSTVVDSMLRVLTSDERNRADRFHFERDRDHFIVGRGTLRKLLGHYLNEEPDSLRFHYGPFGKPALVEECDNAGLRFNISHSRGLALYAFSRDLELGIDLEFVREDFATDDIARRFFAPAFEFTEIQTDNGMEFTYTQLPQVKKQHPVDAYLERCGIAHRLIRASSPNLNGRIERSHGTDKAGFKHAGQAHTVANLQAFLTEDCVRYNTYRPHRALDMKTPLEYLQSLPGYENATIDLSVLNV